MDHEKCYVFTQERPAKRRRVEEAKSLDSSLPLREQLYRDAWAQQEHRINDVVKSANEATLDEVSSFLSDCQHDEESEGLPAGFILAGPSIAAHVFIFEQLLERTQDKRTSVFIPVSSTDGPNLRTLLKVIIKTGTSHTVADEDELALAPSKRNGRKLLDYDLQILHEWVRVNGIKQVIVAFRDCEAFDSVVLSEVIELLSIWSNRIQLVLLFGIATSVDNLQDRLSQAAARSLAGQQFDVVQSDEILEQIFTTSTVYGVCRLRIGAQLSNMLLQRHHENLLSAQDFMDALQYAYMTHFYANPLSVFLSENIIMEDISPEHVEALRNTTSFKRFAEDNLNSADGAHELKDMLESDEVMFESAKDAVVKIQQAFAYLSQAVHVACAVTEQLSKTKLSPSSTYTKALKDNFDESPIVRELLLAVKKAPSDILMQSFQAIEGIFPEAHAASLEGLRTRLQELAGKDISAKPLRSEHDIRADTVRTTVVAQKVQLSRHKAKLSEKDEAYSKIVVEFHDLLTAVFNDVQSPLDLPGHEIVIYDLRMPHRAALTPKPRFALERALCSPHDYLNCKCCAAAANGGQHGEDATMSSTLPPTALLYRLYLESGALINATDLWSAFAAIMEGEGEDDVSKVMPLFQRALAELKYLGLVKPTRKKTDHVAKAAWKGL